MAHLETNWGEHDKISNLSTSNSYINEPLFKHLSNSLACERAEAVIASQSDGQSSWLRPVSGHDGTSSARSSPTNSKPGGMESTTGTWHSVVERLADHFAANNAPAGKQLLAAELFPPGFSGLVSGIGNLLEFTDHIRKLLAEAKSLVGEEERVSLLLEAMILKNVENGYAISLDTIEEVRFDKLLFDLIDISKRPRHPSLKFRNIMRDASSLHKRWTARFGREYTMIDERRLRRMVMTGALREVSFDASTLDGAGLWKAKASDPMSDVEADLQFTPGHWWLNIACAHRDGIVGNEFENPTEGRYGIAALPLLTGQEEIMSDQRIKYIREGERSNMHLVLISQVGSQIRILRGHRLRSGNAPVAGVRYDGLYAIRQYGLKLDAQKNVHRLELLLERVEGQLPFEETRKYPLPSQLDE